MKPERYKLQNVNPSFQKSAKTCLGYKFQLEDGKRDKRSQVTVVPVARADG